MKDFFIIMLLVIVELWKGFVDLLTKRYHPKNVMMTSFREFYRLRE